MDEIGWDGVNRMDGMGVGWDGVGCNRIGMGFCLTEHRHDTADMRKSPGI